MSIRHVCPLVLVLATLHAGAAPARPLTGWSITGGAGSGSAYHDSGITPDHVTRWTGALDVGRTLGRALSLRARVGYHHFDYATAPPAIPVLEIPEPPFAGRRNVSFSGAGLGLRVTRPTARRVAPYLEVLPMAYRARVWDQEPYRTPPAPLTRIVPGVAMGAGVDARLAAHMRAEVTLGYATSGRLHTRGTRWPDPLTGLDQMTAMVGVTWAP
jgi:hypothetical protein